ncbi:MAG: hypothetical protein HY650_11480 [Acidobacteria bacterium]|nr:hypothetical protein [Acidobacteriota bacterium]
MADTLITQLSHIRQIVVRPTSTVSKYMERDQDPLAAGCEQQVDAVLDGSIQRVGDRIRVNVRLLNVLDGSALWAFKCDEQCTDIFATQDAIAERLAAALAPRLTSGEQKQVTRRHTMNTEAYHSYLKGRFFWTKRTRADYEKSIEYFKEAVALDPNYGLAYAGLAQAYYGLQGRPSGSIRDPHSEAKAAALKAVELDDTLAEDHLSRNGTLLFASVRPGHRAGSQDD